MLILDFDKICRLCLTKGEDMVSIFGADGTSELSFSDRIQNCTCLKLATSDGLPGAMCVQCVAKLDLIKEFQDQCERSDTVLRNQLKANNEDVETENILRSKQEGNQEHDQRRTRAGGESRGADRILYNDEPSFNGEVQLNQTECDAYDTSADLSDQPQESSLKNNQKDCDSKPKKKSRSGPRKSKKTKSAPPLLGIGNDNQENDMDFDDHEYSWPGSLSDEEINRDCSSDASKRQDEDSSSHQKQQGKMYICEYCGRGFTRSNHLAQHELTHTKEKPFQCSYCDKGFWYKNSLIGHIKQNHTGDVNFTCEECGRGFFQRSEFMRHLPIHSNETPFTCDECGMSFKLIKNLRRHQKVHTGTRTHTCQYCGKSFRMLQTLRVHLFIHSGEKPFKCNHCGKGFSQSAPLKSHIRSIHTGEKPYVCNMCGEAFPTSNTLKTHVFKHTGVHPYSCSPCSIVFKRKKDLLDHHDIVHGGFVTSPVKVPAQLPLPLQEEDYSQESTQNSQLQQPVPLQDQQLSSPLSQSPTKLEPLATQYMDVQHSSMIGKTEDSMSNDSLSDDALSHNPMLADEKPEIFEISPPVPSHLMSPSSSADELIVPDCLPFS